MPEQDTTLWGIHGGETGDAEAWDALFRYSNRRRGRGDRRKQERQPHSQSRRNRDPAHGQSHGALTV